MSQQLDMFADELNQVLNKQAKAFWKLWGDWQPVAGEMAEFHIPTATDSEGKGHYVSMAACLVVFINGDDYIVEHLDSGKSFAVEPQHIGPCIYRGRVIKAKTEWSTLDQSKRFYAREPDTN